MTIMKIAYWEFQVAQTQICEGETAVLEIIGKFRTVRHISHSDIWQHYSCTDCSKNQGNWKVKLKIITGYCRYIPPTLVHFHPMMTSWHANIFCITYPLWGNSPVTGGFPLQKDHWGKHLMDFYVHLNKLVLSNLGQSWLCCKSNIMIVCIILLTKSCSTFGPATYGLPKCKQLR